MSDNQLESYVRIPYLSYIRAIACFFIIVLHTATVTEILYRDQLTEPQIAFSKIIVHACMWAVPCFLMVTGVLQLKENQDNSLQVIVKVFIWRILKALIFCCIIFRIFDTAMDKEAFSIRIVGDILKDIFTGGSWSHLWYIYMLIGLYLFLPIFRAIVKQSDAKTLKYLIGLTVFFLSVLPLTQIRGWESAFIIPLATIYPVYLIAGYAIDKNIIRIGKPLAIGLTAAGLVLTVLMTVCKVYSSAELPAVFIGSYASPATVILSFGVFVLFKDWHLPPAGDRILYRIDRCSFGIYLLHMIFIRLIFRYWGFNPFTHGAAATILITLGVFIVSYLLVEVLKYIPIVKNVL